MIDALQDTRLNSFWTQGDWPPQTDAESLQNALYSLNQPFVLVDQNGQPAAARGGSLAIELSGNRKDSIALRDSSRFRRSPSGSGLYPFPAPGKSGRSRI